LNTLYKVVFVALLTIGITVASPCRDLTNSVEKMICSSADLTLLQEKLDFTFNEVIKKSKIAQIERLKREHVKWRTKRNQCETSDCIHNHIMNRMTALDHYLKTRSK